MTPYSEVSGLLREAIDAGELATMPVSDWAPGQLGVTRAPEAPLPRRQNNDQIEARAIRLSFSLAEQGARLTKCESLLLLALADAEFASKNRLHELVSPESEPKIIDVFVCKLRAKITSLQIHIETIWGRGYRISGESRTAVLRMAE
jgi:DNA-binding response OmpR family regulator